MRKITSMTMFLSFTVVILNSVVLYVVPEGRVAYWADWTFLGMTKSQWGQQHTTVGFLFIAAGLLHTYFNWHRIVTYMQNKVRETKIFTKPFSIALAVVAVFIVGTYYQIPPISSINHLSEHFKESAAETYGEPPYGHAESSSLKMFVKREGFDLQKAMQLLEGAGIKVLSEKNTLKEIANGAGKSPQHIYNIIKLATVAELNLPDASAAVELQAFPDAPQSGWGNKTLAEVCELYGLNRERIIHKLSDKGISAEGDRKIKEIAAENGLQSMELFEMLHEIVNHAGH